jgi:tetratricopeptide (TPR) repeat protein
LTIREKALGSEHPDVGTTLNNLADLYRRQGRFADAEPLYKRSLAIAENALGSEHFHVGQSLTNLAAFYHAQGRLAEAEFETAQWALASEAAASLAQMAARSAKGRLSLLRSCASGRTSSANFRGRTSC